MEVETTIDPRFSSPEAEPTTWPAAIERVAGARTYWITTVRPDGRPHATTVAGVWLDGAFHFSTGRSEQKAKNLASGNRHVLATIGSSDWDGLDIIIEGDAVRVTDPAHLERFTDAMKQKYDDFFKLRVVNGRLQGGAGAADIPLAFEVRATKAFGFEKGASFGQTRWRFNRSNP